MPDRIDRTGKITVQYDIGRGVYKHYSGGVTLYPIDHPVEELNDSFMLTDRVIMHDLDTEIIETKSTVFVPKVD